MSVRFSAEDTLAAACLADEDEIVGVIRTAGDGAQARTSSAFDEAMRVMAWAAESFT